MFGKNIIENNLNNLFFFLICLYPLFLISGPFLSDAVLIIISTYFIIILIKKKNYNLLNNFFFKCFIIFNLYLVITSLLNDSSLFSLKSVVPFIRFGIFIFAIRFILDANHNKINILFFSYLIIFFILVFDSVFQKVFGYNIIGASQFHSIRISSFFFDKLILGSYTIKILPILCALIIFANQKPFLLNIVIAFSLILILLSAEKAAFFLFLLFLIFYIIGVKTKIINKLLIMILILTLGTILLIHDKGIFKRLLVDYRSNSGYGKYIFSRVHDSHFRTAYKMFIDKPIIGQGPNTYRIKCSKKEFIHDEYSCSTHPHNYYIQLLAETGVFGFLFLFTFFIYLCMNILKFLIKIYKNYYYDDKVYFSLIGVFLILFPISSFGNFFNNWNGCIYSFVIGFYFFFLEDQKKNKS